MLRTAISALLRRFHRQESGQVLVLTVIMLSVFGGIVAMAVDLGALTAQRRDLQNAADAIALAASLELPDEAAALAAADQWADNNDIDHNSMIVNIIPQDLPAEPNPKVEVELSREHTFIFAPLIGVTSATVLADAAAIKTSPGGGANMVPIGVALDAFEGECCGDPVVIKYDARELSQGNAGPVRIDGPGNGNCRSSDNYCSGVMSGSESTICAYGTDPTYCDGPTEVDTQPGDLIAGTRRAIEYRLDNTDPLCNEFDEVFFDDPFTSGSDTYRLTQDCNPYISSSLSSLQVILVPVVCAVLDDGTCEGNFSSCTGTCEMRIVEFALFFLEGFSGTGCTGNDCEIMGTWVRVNQNVGFLAGTFDPDATNHFVRLVK
jgi:Flp pilus assembly protein TadG